LQTKITHLTSAHGRYDTKIFLKICSSLAKNENYDVNIIDVGAKTGGRISRMTNTVK
jgi:hypothetical protein